MTRSDFAHVIIIDPAADVAAGFYGYAESVLNDVRTLLPSLRVGAIVLVEGWRYEVLSKTEQARAERRERAHRARQTKFVTERPADVVATSAELALVLENEQ